MSDWVTWSKLLPNLIYPFNLVLWFLVFSLVLLLFRRYTVGKICLSLAIAILILCGSPFSTELYRRHEVQHMPVPLHLTPEAGAIVLLGGDVGIPISPRIASQVGGNRAPHAFRLYKAGKAPVIVISGGNVFPQKNTQPESIYTAAFLADWGVPSEAILIEGTSRNTYENARETKKLLDSLDIKKVILVTSAFHMPRALATFRQVGLNTVPSPSSYSIVAYSRPEILDWIPSLGNLRTMQALIREKLGIFIYQYRGWMAREPAV